jgi:hypothetical protein
MQIAFHTYIIVSYITSKLIIIVSNNRVLVFIFYFLITSSIALNIVEQILEY